MKKNEKSKSGLLFVLSAPSGAGKTTLADYVIEQLSPKCPIRRLVTYTTRAQRPQEIDGRDYHFVSDEKFKQLESAEFFFETNDYNGFWYGSPRNFLDEMATGTSFLAVTDINGLAAYKRTVKPCVTIWVTVPSLAVLEARLCARGTEDGQAIARRLAIADREMKEAAELMSVQPPLIDFVIINDDLSRAKQVLIEFAESKLPLGAHDL